MAVCKARNVCVFIRIYYYYYYLFNHYDITKQKENNKLKHNRSEQRLSGEIPHSYGERGDFNKNIFDFVSIADNETTRDSIDLEFAMEWASTVFKLTAVVCTTFIPVAD